MVVCAALTLAAAVVLGQDVYSDPRARAKYQRISLIRSMASRQARYYQNLGLDRIMDQLGIKPGMTILDIGTGTGAQAFECAKRVGSHGRVFATDIDSDMIDYVGKEASRRGLTNIYSVLVKEEGIDTFYSRHRYDRILLFHTFHHISNPIPYFKKLRSTLTADGRLFVLESGGFDLFTYQDMTDPAGLARALWRESRSSPYRRHLHSHTEKLLTRYMDGRYREPSESLIMALMIDFNRMIHSTDFFRDFLDGSRLRQDIELSPLEKAHVNLFLDYVRDEGTLNKPIQERGLDWSLLRRVQKPLLVHRFRPYLYNGMLPYLPGADGVFRDSSTTRATVRTLLKAGYRLERESDQIPFEQLMVFRP